jgi:hypothetical protein
MHVVFSESSNIHIMLSWRAMSRTNVYPPGNDWYNAISLDTRDELLRIYFVQ